MFDDTVANDIHLWQRDVDEDPALRERVIHAAERAHADHFIRDLPNGYQTVVGDRGVRLSGGQRLFVAHSESTRSLRSQRASSLRNRTCCCSMRRRATWTPPVSTLKVLVRFTHSAAR